jgi:hypothetical protein
MIANGAPTPVAVTARITPKSAELDRLMVVSPLADFLLQHYNTNEKTTQAGNAKLTTFFVLSLALAWKFDSFRSA